MRSAALTSHHRLVGSAAVPWCAVMSQLTKTVDHARHPGFRPRRMIGAMTTVSRSDQTVCSSGDIAPSKIQAGNNGWSHVGASMLGQARLV